MSKAKMEAARELIQEKRYAEARAILRTIDHDKAREWLAKLDKIAPEVKSSSGRRSLLLIIGLVIFLGIGLPFARNGGLPTAVAVVSSGPTATEISAPTVKITSTPTSTPTSSPTRTPKPTLTSTPTSTDTPIPTDTDVPLPTNRPRPTISRKVKTDCELQLTPGLQQCFFIWLEDGGWKMVGARSARDMVSNLNFDNAFNLSWQSYTTQCGELDGGCISKSDAHDDFYEGWMKVRLG